MASKPQNDPISLFRDWFEAASQHPDIKEANAVNLATAWKNAAPSNRMVLLKDYDEHGFVFYTNLESRKGRQLAENPAAAMCFYWEPMGRQLRIEGRITPVTAEEADAYFASRALQSRIGAWASQQSRPLESQATLMKEVAKQAARFVTQEVPRPEYWSGFRLEPNYMEFWQRGEFRLHDRLSFTRDESGQWQSQLLYP